ncbi:thermonuclease family protein [Agilicoccus flavus]|uniref:thermonuclease family protein n=1 Tax=Agilicoccus flavus TaxID=2775968 RepID=UPI001CF68FB9|nr:thermonuclease family protein [Agilicoccus flavus]
MGKLVGGAIGVVIALVLLPLWLPIVAVGWGVRRLRTPGPTGRPRRGRAVAAIAAGLVFAGGAWPALATARSGSPPPTADTAPTTPASAPTAEPEAPPTPSVTPAAPVATTVPDPVDTDDVVVTGAAAQDSDSASDPAASTADHTPEEAPEGGLVPVVGVVDGDTIKVRVDGRTERVRVIGIDTPELAGDECFAQEAASRMQSLAQSRSVRLSADPTQDDRDRYGRLLRHVILADGRSAARVLIGEGFGREYTYDAAYRGQAEHRRAQESARAAGRGVWSSGCATAPTEASADQQASATAPSPSAGRCDIKGNISGDGEKIYHVPGGRSYAKTRIDEGKGERMFCSEDQALAAGWRAARD